MNGMNTNDFLKSKGNNESPYGEVIWNFDTASNEWLADLLEEYAQLKILNIQNVSSSASANKCTCDKCTGLDTEKYYED
jgi:hypothetical protein